MQKLNNWIVQKVYRPFLKKYPIMETSAFILKYRLLPYLRGKGECRGKNPTWKMNRDECLEIKKIAVICDNMTWHSLQGLCEIIYITPQNWYKQLEENRPQLFFCESAWSGIDGSWSYKIHWNRRLLTDNRRALLNILEYCKKAGIPTVFWNKEDPGYFDHIVNGFSDTAIRFDHIFTTAEECVDKYHELGHKSVHTMMFGFSPGLFSPVELEGGENTAVFHGGWYSDLPQRCDAMRQVFNEIISQGMELIIYDRYYGTKNENNLFPDEYKKYIRKAVPYENLNDTLKNARYVININSVTESKTMFARRVFEMMACGRIIISNYSVGMDRLFKNSVWFVGRPFDRSKEEEYIKTNLCTVFKHHTIKKRFDEMFSILGFSISENKETKDG